jgi:hypothetical protein
MDAKVQHRRKAGTRSWAESEDLKRKPGDQLPGRQLEPAADSAELLLSAAIRRANKEAQDIKPRVRAVYARELKRLRTFHITHLPAVPAGASVSCAMEFAQEADFGDSFENPSQKKMKTRKA